MSTRRTSAPARQNGFGLVETMISLTIGLLIVAGLVTAFEMSTRTHREQMNAGQQIENGRFAIQLLGNDLRHAGYYGEFTSPATPAGALPDPCEVANLAALRSALALPIQGYDAPAASPVSCIDNADFEPGTDVLVVRRADTAVTAPASVVGGELYLQSNSVQDDATNPVLALGSNAAAFTLRKKDGATPADLRKYRVHIYFVRRCSEPVTGTTCTAAADGGTPRPTLSRAELQRNPSTGALEMRIVPLVEGVENLQIDYGIDTDNDGSPDAAFVTAPGSVADWANVMVVRMSLLARNPQPTPGYVDPKTYDLGAAGTVTPGGSFKRHVFAANVRLHNPSARREAP